MFLSRWRRRGQSTTEYILIVVLVAVLSIGIITVFGNQIRDLFGVATKRLGGDDNAMLHSDITNQADGNVRKSMADLKDSGGTP
jgi:pilus assembly protein Flp/PilA